MIDNRYTEQIKIHQVPSKPVNFIPSTDPRNNYRYLSLNKDTVVFEENINDEESVYQKASKENYDLSSILNININLPGYQSIYQASYPPSNLSIDTTSYKLQTDSNDGTVYYTVSLNFSDALGVNGYEYRIGIA